MADEVVNVESVPANSGRALLRRARCSRSPCTVACWHANRAQGGLRAYRVIVVVVAGGGAIIAEQGRNGLGAVRLRAEGRSSVRRTLLVIMAPLATLPSWQLRHIMIPGISSRKLRNQPARKGGLIVAPLGRCRPG